MKIFALSIVSWFFAAFSYKAMAQGNEKENSDKKESQEIIIRKLGDKDAKLTIELTGDKVLINGKPLMEFKDDAITINKRNIIVRDGDHFTLGDDFDFDFKGLEELKNMTWNNSPRTFLGVVSEKADDGIKIVEITKDSPAEKAGLKKDDVITHFGDKKITTSQELYDAVVKMKAGDQVKVKFKRGNKNDSVKAVLAEKNDGMSFSMTTPDGGHRIITVPTPPHTYRSAPRGRIEGMDGREFEHFGGDENLFQFPRPHKLGLRIQDTEDASGVKIMDVDDESAAGKAGLKEDDIITEIAGKKITNTDEARNWLQENKDKASYNVKVKREGKEISVDIKIPKKLKTTSL